jgi:hypothetical protein
MPSACTPLERPQRSRVTPATVDRIDEENAGCVTARDVPYRQQPRRFLPGTARTYSTLIKIRLTIFTAVPRGQQSLCSFTSWDNPLLYAWTAVPTAVSEKAHRGHLRRF